MRICLLTYRGNRYCGGQGIYVYYLSREFRRLGHEVEVISGAPYPEVADGIPLHRLPSPESYGLPEFRTDHHRKDFIRLYESLASWLGFFPEPFTFSLRAYYKIKRLQRRGKQFDILHDNQCLGYGLLMLKRLGFPVVATIHHPIPIDLVAALRQARSFGEKCRYIRFYSFTLMQFLVSRRLDHIIAVSQNAADEIRRWFKVPSKKLKVIYNGVDTDIFRPLGEVPKQPGSIIMVGNTEDRKKGVLYLLQALALLKDEMEVKLTLVDREPEDLSYVPELVRKFGLGHCVSVTGRLDTEELVRHYASAEVAIVPSLYEGFGFPAVEAMACGLPVVATSAGALSEVVKDGETGILVPPGDPQRLAAALRTLLKDETLRRRLGAAARDHVRRNFSWEQAARRTIEVYQEVMENAHR